MLMRTIIPFQTQIPSQAGFRIGNEITTIKRHKRVPRSSNFILFYMPKSLLDLPDEILEVCVGYVALDNPHYFNQCPADIFDTESLVFGTPRDILNLRLVCQKLRRICAPRTWAAVDLRYDYDFDLRYEGQSGRVSKWKYYTTKHKPSHTRHIRALSIIYHRRRKLREQDRPAEVEVLSLLPLVTQARKLRLVRVEMSIRDECPDTDADCSIIVNALLRLPLLQTVIIPCIGGLQLMPVAVPNIINLRMNNCDSLSSLLPLTPQLQSLAIPRCDPGQIFPPTILPWGTLREVEIYDGFGYIVNNLLCWKNLHQERHVPLKEASFYGSNIDLTEMEHFFRVFDGIRLTTLYLGCLRIIDDAILNGLVNSFPRLQRLIIISECSLTPWGFTLEEIVRYFSKLRHLEYLGWNYSMDKEEGPADDLRIRSRAIVPIMGLACKRLRAMHYFFYDEFSYAFTIERGDQGDVDYVYWHIGGPPCGPNTQTSIWLKCLESISQM
ncbi:hypothetical protein BU17DRAFT_82177 [Hysterangium stoloniferum]|nr:hypothetical protein BU17DRAFT_82177 [Hysterangium stoloniferum]